MSKKNKALKQLLKAQMQANAVAVAQKKDLPHQILTSNQPTATTAPMPYASGQPLVVDKQASEFALIKKDIRLSLVLISLVIICLLVIFFADKAHPFLLPLANKIFQLISK